jgi:hypothetical protein
VWKIGIDPRRHNYTATIHVGLSRNLVLALRLRRRTVQLLAQPKRKAKYSFP